MLTICVMLYLMHFLANSCRILGDTSFLLFRVGYECICENHVGMKVLRNVFMN